jgi:hypothetical protein
LPHREPNAIVRVRVVVRPVQVDLTIVVGVRVRNVREVVDTLFSNASGKAGARMRGPLEVSLHLTHVGQKLFLSFDYRPVKPWADTVRRHYLPGILAIQTDVGIVAKIKK